MLTKTIYGFDKQGDGRFDVLLVTLPDGVTRRRLGTVFGGYSRWVAEAPDGKFATSGHKTRDSAARALHRYHFRANPLA